MTLPSRGDFVFGKPETVVREGDFVAHVGPGIRGKQALLAELQRSLELPDYFGGNWDALSDCLRDLHWRNEPRVVIIHEGLPILERGELGVYADLLGEAVQLWRDRGDRDLVVVFPRDALRDLTDQRQG